MMVNALVSGSIAAKYVQPQAELKIEFFHNTIKIIYRSKDCRL
jgi:hypothetical protein